MAAASFDSPTEGLDFVQTPHVQTVRGDYVHSAYIARAHRGADLSAVVTQNGVPIQERGQVLKVGMIPPERRYAVGPVVDGRAEVLPRLDFEAEHLQHYVDAYAQTKGAKLDNPALRHIPAVRAFVAVTVHPSDARRLLPLGQPVEGGPPPAPPETFWSDTLGREVTQAEVVALGQNRSDPRDAELKLLNAKLEALTAKLDAVAAPEPKAAKPAKALKTAPCGKQMATGMPMHAKHCKKPECAEARAPKE